MIASEIKNYFESNYNSRPLVVKAPGRINLIGEHTDYNLGYVLPASIEKGIYFAVSGNAKAEINIETFLTSPEKITFNLKGKHTAYNAGWGNYFKAIIEILVENNYPLKGMDCVFGGDIPIGSGLSSSAALCCGFLYALSKVCEQHITREDIALIAQKAEHKIGLNCGLMDQYAVLFGKSKNALFLDCRDLSHKYIPVNLKGYSWVLINSKITHNLAVDSEYNKRRISCENIVAKIAEKRSEITSLRDVTMNDLKSIESDVNPTDYKRAHYIIAENQRVLKMIEVLNSGDAIQVGNILLEGHWAMSKEFEITTKELDYLVESGQDLEGIMGSRMMGGGFGGCTINLIKTETVEENLKKILYSYKNQTGINAEVYRLNIDDGVHIVEDVSRKEDFNKKAVK
ncbi:galactokinase [Maribacter sp. 2210JD10-5]|uniref:galactokinase n=1 Tax=Maribacter sp. 2210JD10-5 TaxID=3386272 RepID=UPI0039BCE4EA